MNLNEKYLLKFLYDADEVYSLAEEIQNVEHIEEQGYFSLYFSK